MSQQTSLSLHDLLDALLSDHTAKEDSHQQEERRCFDVDEKYWEGRVQALAKLAGKRPSPLIVEVDEQGNKIPREPSESELRQMARLARDEWTKGKCDGERPESAWEQTLWEYAVPILVSDHAFKGDSPEKDIDVRFGRLRWFLRLRRRLQQGEPEPQERESLADLADIAAELDRLNTPTVVQGLLLKLWGQYPCECEGMGLPKPEPAAGGGNASAWVPAIRLWREKFSTSKELTKFRRDHPDMFRNPSRFKLEIHAGLWTDFWGQRDKAGFEALDGNLRSVADDPNVQEDALAAAAQRAANLRAKKQQPRKQ